jgi:inositol 2-dehydrogenase
MVAVLNLGIMGLGRMGRLYAQTIATQVPTARIVAVADPHADAITSLGIDVPHTFAMGEEMLGLAGLDAVVIATPTSTHADLVVAAARAGKAIYCEKPLALSIADSRRAMAAVEAAGVPLQIGFMRRFDAAYVRAKQIIDSGEIGTPVTFKSVGRDPFCPRVEFADPAKSGGLIIDMGIHDFDLARWLTGAEVDRVSAEGTLMVCKDLATVGDIDNATVNLRFVTGAIGNVELSRNAFYGYDIRTEVLGTDGAVTIGAYQQTPVLTLTRAGARHDIVPYLMERFGSAYQAEIVAFAECIRNGTPPVVGATDALAAFEIGLAATIAAREERAVALAELRD